VDYNKPFTACTEFFERGSQLSSQRGKSWGKYFPLCHIQRETSGSSSNKYWNQVSQPTFVQHPYTTFEHPGELSDWLPRSFRVFKGEFVTRLKWCFEGHLCSTPYILHKGRFVTYIWTNILMRFEPRTKRAVTGGRPRPVCICNCPCQFARRQHST